MYNQYNDIFVIDFKYLYNNIVTVTRSNSILFLSSPTRIIWMIVSHILRFLWMKNLAYHMAQKFVYQN